MEKINRTEHKQNTATI